MRTCRILFIGMALLPTMARQENAFAQPRRAVGDAAVRSDTEAPAEATAAAPQAQASSQPKAKRIRVYWIGFQGARQGNCRSLAQSEVQRIIGEAVVRFRIDSSRRSPVTYSAASSEPVPAIGALSAYGRCSAISPRGKQCERNALLGSQFCRQHRK